MTASAALPPLPGQPAGVPWPDDDWPRAAPPWAADLERAVAAAFDETGPLATTYAVVVVQGGRVVAERYGGALPHFDQPSEPVGAGTRLASWSMAKSFLHAALAFLVEEGRLDLDAPAPVPQWAAPDDPRRRITIADLLAMRDGLAFVEDYTDDRVSDVIQMLWGPGQDDVAAFAAERPLAAPPGQRYQYSSGTTNILAGVLARVVGPGEPVRRFLSERLFAPIGMRSATVTLDEAGTWVASSYLRATALDFARFGLLYLRDGVWDRRRLLPPGWVDHARTPLSYDEEDAVYYGNHWWVTGDAHGTFLARGYEGQQIAVSPALDLVVVRLGSTPADRYPELARWRTGLLDTVAAGVAGSRR